MRRQTWIIVALALIVVVVLGYLFWPMEIEESTLPGATTEEPTPDAVPPAEPTVPEEETPAAPGEPNPQ